MRFFICLMLDFVRIIFIIDADLKELVTASHDTSPSYEFGELLALNEGVVLEPLASNTPPEKLDMFTVSGIAATPQEVLNGIIRAYGVGDEIDRMREKLRHIRIEAKDRARVGSFKPLPLLNEPLTASAVETVPVQEAAENTSAQDHYKIIDELVFPDSDDPDIRKVYDAISLDPFDPGLPIELGKVFKSHGRNYDGIAKSSPRYKEVEEIIAVGWDAYRDAIFENPKKIHPLTLGKMVKEWVSVALHPEGSTVSVSLHLGVVKAALMEAIMSASSARVAEEVLLDATEGLQELADMVGLYDPRFIRIKEEVKAKMNESLSSAPEDLIQGLRSHSGGRRVVRYSEEKPPTPGQVLMGQTRGSVVCHLQIN